MRMRLTAKASRFLIIVVLVIVPAAWASSLTPIARWDIVPNQRITGSETFKAGIIAFSKEGIREVEFEISGQGYSGARRISKTSMTHNSRTDVYEYWIELRGGDFTESGPVFLDGVAYGNDGDSLELERLTLYVNPNGALAKPEAWVDAGGNDSTGAIGNRSRPFQTISGAIAAIQGANNGYSDGAVIYLFEGSYTLGSGSTSTLDEWLTITKDESARKENTIITNAGTSIATKYLKFENLTIRSLNAGDIFMAMYPTNLWVDNCQVIGAGQHSSRSNPVFRSGSPDETPTYFTNTTITDVDYGMHRGNLARNVSMKNIGNDAFVNVLMIVNARAENLNPGDTYWHSDGYQSWGEGPINRIIYGFYATNLHCQGLFMRETTQAQNNAFVNMFIEMREPGYPGYAGGPEVLDSGGIYGEWDHLLLWHCTFIGGPFYVIGEANETPGIQLTNSSVVGNVFYQFLDAAEDVGDDPPYAEPNNAEGNEFLYNHFIWSAVDQGGANAEEPHWHSKSPDSSLVGSTATLGDPGLQTTLYSEDTFGYPENGSVLINRIPFQTIPVDALGKPRDDNPDVGALEGDGGEADWYSGISIITD